MKEQASALKVLTLVKELCKFSPSGGRSFFVLKFVANAQNVYFLLRPAGAAVARQSMIYCQVALSHFYSSMIF